MNKDELLLDPVEEYRRQFCWKNTTTGYWYFRRELLHRLLMGTPEGLDTDHINRNKSDNRRENLRIVTRSENMFNTDAHKDNMYSNHKRVSYLKSGQRKKRWRVRVQEEGKARTLGYFLTEEEAVQAAKEYDDEFIQQAIA